jgi:DMSO reductase family type II enzyme heme b subunit
VGALGVLAVAALLAVQDTAQGRAVYDRWCSACHGSTGAGDGPAASYMLPRPRDFTAALYQIRTTASGQLPTDADLEHVVDVGLPGTAMPGWETQLSSRERRDVIAYIKTFSPFFADTTQRPQVLEFSSAPGVNDEGLRVGRQFYDSIGCVKCHGDAGRGNGPSAPTLFDDTGSPIRAADLTQAWHFNGGSTSQDVYRRLRTGLDGTPMPSFSDLIDQQFLTDEQLWRVAQYVHSLSSEDEPRPAEVITAVRVATLPGSPDDSAWGGVASFYVPLVGQVIRKARWFAPAVTAVWVQAVHDGRSLALRVAWNDRSESPDTSWADWQARLAQAMASDDSADFGPGRYPDQLALQFPRRLSQGTELPYFLMGSSSEPVYQWRWHSAPRGVEEGSARGFETWEPQAAAAQNLTAAAVYDAGQWRVQFTRALVTADTVGDLAMPSGVAIPIAFFAWDGSSGEHGTRASVSSWTYLALAEPTPASVYITPVVAMLVIAGLGYVVVSRAQRGS